MKYILLSNVRCLVDPNGFQRIAGKFSSSPASKSIQCLGKNLTMQGKPSIEHYCSQVPLSGD